VTCTLDRDHHRIFAKLDLLLLGLSGPIVGEFSVYWNWRPADPVFTPTIRKGGVPAFPPVAVAGVCSPNKKKLAICDY
jgi:hypothetical protein